MELGLPLGRPVIDGAGLSRLGGREHRGGLLSSDVDGGSRDGREQGEKSGSGKDLHVGQLVLSGEWKTVDSLAGERIDLEGED